MKRRGNISYMLFLAVTAAVGGLLFGYDTAVISGTVELVTARFGLDSLQQGWYVGCALAGSIAGVLCSGVLSDRLGRRRTMLVSAVLFTVSAAGCALCADFTQLVVYRIVGGLGIGVVSVVSPPGHAGLVLPAGRHDGISGGLYGQLPAAPHGTDRRFRNGVDAVDLRR